MFTEGMELVSGVGAIGLVVALVQVAKGMGFPKKMAPVLAIGLGLAASFGLNFFADHPVYQSIVIGLAIGLSSIGAYSGAKNVSESRNQK